MTSLPRGGITPEERGTAIVPHRRGTEGTQHLEGTGLPSTVGGSGTERPSSPAQRLNRAPTREQHRLVLDNFGVNQWALTDAHRRKIEFFIRQLLRSADYEILLIEGRASNTGPESETEVRRGSAGPGNVELSRLRAESVLQLLNERDLFSSHTPQVRALGSSSPLVSAEGEVGRNRSVVVSYTLIRVLPPVAPQPPAPIRTRRWALSITQTASGGEIVGGLLADGKLKNLNTNRIYDVKIWAIGLTGGWPFGVSGAPDSFQPFETIRPVDALAFSGVSTAYEALTYATIRGYSVAVVRFPHRSEDAIWLSGPVGGLDASGFLGTGTMNFSDSSLARARTERRDYRRLVEAYNRQLEAYNQELEEYDRQERQRRRESHKRQ